MAIFDLVLMGFALQDQKITKMLNFTIQDIFDSMVHPIN